MAIDRISLHFDRDKIGNDLVEAELKRRVRKHLDNSEPPIVEKHQIEDEIVAVIDDALVQAFKFKDILVRGVYRIGNGEEKTGTDLQEEFWRGAPSRGDYIDWETNSCQYEIILEATDEAQTNVAHGLRAQGDDLARFIQAQSVVLDRDARAFLSSLTVPPRPKVPLKDIEQVYRERVADIRAEKKMTTEIEDDKWALGMDFPRQVVRELRKKLAPDWCLPPGRRKKAQ